MDGPFGGINQAHWLEWIWVSITKVRMSTVQTFAVGIRAISIRQFDSCPSFQNRMFSPTHGMKDYRSQWQQSKTTVRRTPCSPQISVG